EAAFTIRNSGPQTSGPITIVSTRADFAIRSDCISGATTLAPNDSCLVRVTFSPQLAGARSGTVNFSANPGGSGRVAVSGAGACTAGGRGGGNGTCVPIPMCASGHHNEGTGNCRVNTSCP